MRIDFDFYIKYMKNSKQLDAGSYTEKLKWVRYTYRIVNKNKSLWLDRQYESLIRCAFGYYYSGLTRKELKNDLIELMNDLNIDVEVYYKKLFWKRKIKESDF